MEARAGAVPLEYLIVNLCRTYGQAHNGEKQNTTHGSGFYLTDAPSWQNRRLEGA